jgi:hypothetical protein
MVSEVSDLSIYHPIRIRNYYMLVVVLILNVFKIEEIPDLIAILNTFNIKTTTSI